MFYNGDELLSRHYALNFICGDRFGGKSTFAQKYVLKRAVDFYENQTKAKKHQEFAVLVRYDKDIATLCATYFANTMDMFYPDYELKFCQRKFFIKRKGDDEKAWLLVGYGFALNQATKMKSTSYPYITTMILEEFMNLEGKYIKSASNPDLEVELLISLYSTIARGNGKQVRNNVRVFLISNNFYLNNPYFRYFGLIEKITKNPFKRFYELKTEPTCIVEMTHNDVRLSIGRDDVNKGNKFIDMQHQLHIANITTKKPLYQLTFDNRTFLSVCSFNDSLGIRQDEYDPDTLCFSCSEIRKARIAGIKVYKSMDTYKTLNKLLEANLLYYDKLESYITLYNILNFSPA